jgi:acyl-coenzyme A thioesterase PaaI-like protein
LNDQELKDKEFIRNQVLRGIAMNRVPGYHFIGNFLGISFDRVAVDDARLTLDAAPHCAEADGGLNLSALAVLADLALAATVRAGLDPATRLATVHMHLHFTGVPLTGRLEAAGALQRFLQDAAAPQGIAQVAVNAAGGLACYGSGAFMVLKPPPGVELHPMPQPRRGDPAPALPAAGTLHRDELKVLKHAQAMLESRVARGDSFIRHFLGFEPHHVAGGAACSVKNGPHIGNRVGHVQGGVLFGLAAATACAALPASWMLTGVSAWYISPGEGRTLKIRSKIVHHGRLTSVVRTQVSGKNNRRVLEVMTSHAHRAGR